MGARPNFVKIAPIINIYKKNNSDYVLVHTGQHYDKNMSDIFFKEMNVLNSSLNLKELSMGMSSDYLDALKNSATYIRIGSKIFGKRS